MVMLKLKWKKSWFTLAEIIVVCSIFAVMVVWMIFGINRAFVFLNGIRLQVMATNFVREWVEMMYNIRDSNWRKNPWDRDEHRMDAWKWTQRLEPWIYIIKEEGTWVDSYVYTEFLTGNTDIYSLEWFFDKDNSSYRERSKLLFTGSYSYNSGWTIVTWDMNELMDWFWIDFYRILRVYGIYGKNTSNSSDLINGDNLKNWTPAELRFCVMVFYTDNRSQHSKELCSIITNFLE